VSLPSAPSENDSERHESVAERADRNLAELLQELRVAGLGVQVLFGFLLSIPFTMRFVKLSQAQRDLYLVTLLLAALSTALLTGPVAYHRIVFHRHEKTRLLATANVMALAGLVTVGLAISCAVLLVTSFVVPGVAGPLIAGALAAVFATLWFALPIWRRTRDRGEA
jgi:O-antigen/teichoic acid export membrane protein